MLRKLYALSIGVACHFAFGVGISLMAYMLFWGMTRGIYPVGGSVGRLTNWILTLQFPILHSLFLTPVGKLLLAKFHPISLAKDMASTSFAILASIQLILTFTFWTPETSVWFAPAGLWWWLAVATHILAWAFLSKAIFDSGLALQSGFLGWSAVFRNSKPVYGKFSTRGLFQYCRQPIYLGFFLILISAPVWSFDHFLIASVWGVYCIVGPILKEKRLVRLYGQAYQDFQAKVPFFIPQSTSNRI